MADKRKKEDPLLVLVNQVTIFFLRDISVEQRTPETWLNVLGNAFYHTGVNPKKAENYPMPVIVEEKNNAAK